ncbi:unnamed protein product, partial [Ascophyllum nodosum]
CKSQDVSHFAAFFIVVGAKTSVAETSYGNDPSAGSPTETLLRLHLPLNVEV